MLLLTDRVDEWLMSHLTEFEGKHFQSVAKGALDLDKIASEEEKQEQKQAEDQFKDLLTRVKEVLGDKVKDVRISSRLTDSPACLVVDEHALSAHLERLLRDAGQSVPMSKPYLELNPHPFAGRPAEGRSRRGPLQRLDPPVVRAGGAGGRGATGRPGQLRQTVEWAAADDGPLKRLHYTARGAMTCCGRVGPPVGFCR